jgi:hypothetical protein
MNALKLVSLIFVLLFATARAAEPVSFQSSSASLSPPPHPALYSFADVYRLTTAGKPLTGTAAEAPVRVAAMTPAHGAELRFLISPPRAPEKWLLILAGVALAGWVAHRRLAHQL